MKLLVSVRFLEQMFQVGPIVEINKTANPGTVEFIIGKDEKEGELEGILTSHYCLEKDDDPNPYWYRAEYRVRQPVGQP
jgi:hypothetical protein